MPAIKLTREQWGEVFDILVSKCAADATKREYFIDAVTDEKFPATEFRFMGALGFGGKLYNAYSRVYVSCYREDSTPAREKMIEETNKLLEKFSVCG